MPKNIIWRSITKINKPIKSKITKFLDMFIIEDIIVRKVIARAGRITVISM